MKILLVLITLFCCGQLYAQSIQDVLLFGAEKDERGYDVLADDNGYVILCSTRSIGNGSEDILLIKTDTSGVILYQATIGGLHHDYPRKLLKLNDGGYFIVGTVWDGGFQRLDGVLIKVNDYFQEEWRQYYGGYHRDEFFDIERLGNDKYLLAGFTKSTGDLGELYMVLVDGSGNTLSEVISGETSKDYAFGVESTSDGGFLVCGNYGGYSGMSTFEFTTPNINIVLEKYSANANLIWKKVIDNGQNDFANEVVFDGDDNYYMIGSAQGGGNGSFDMYLVKMDTTGNVIWQKFFGGANYDYGMDILLDGGEMYVLGTKGKNTSFDAELYVAKMDTSGTTIWEQTYTTDGHIEGASIQRDREGVVIVGTIEKVNPNETDALIIRYNANGEIIPFTEGSAEEEELMIFPSPATDYVNFLVLGGGDCSEFYFEVFDAMGRAIHREITQGGVLTIPVQSRSRGVYFCRVSSPCFDGMTGKFVKY